MPAKLSDHDILSLLPRAPEKRSTSDLQRRLAATGKTITLRSLQRRLISLSNAHAVVSDERGKPFGWSVATNGPANLGELSVQQAMAFKLSEQYLKMAMPPDLLLDLKHYFARADEKLKDQSLYREWLKKFRLIPAHQPLETPSVPRSIRTRVYEGVLRGFMLEISYRRRGAATSKTHKIEPLAIAMRGNITYLIALFPTAGDEDVSMFALHRILAATLMDTPIRQGHDFDLDEYIAMGTLGFTHTKEQTLRLRFYEGVGAQLEETHLTESQKLRHVDGQTIELTARLTVTEQLKWWLLGFGDRVEVLAPKALREEFRILLSNASQRYT